MSSMEARGGDADASTGVAKIDMKRRDEPPDIFQAELDPEALEAIQPGERLFVGRESRHGGLPDFHGTTEK